MKLERRAAAVLGVVALIAIPAAVLRVLCVGHACDQDQTAARKVPFCSLPARTRVAIAAGYREGRSPDILAVTERNVRLTSPPRPPGIPWPSIDRDPGSVPVVFWGRRVPAGAVIEQMSLADITPSLARMADFDIPHPEVRSGRPVVGDPSGPAPRLLVEIVLRDVPDLATDPVLKALAAQGASSNAAIDSLPRDPAALLATIGTGGTPSEHGITGTTLRNDNARVATAWEEAGDAGPRATPPRSVIATLADDLDETLGQEPLIGLVADTPQARGLVGGNWYVDNDRDDLAIVPSARVMPTLERLLRRGFGRDEVPDLLAISLRPEPTVGVSAALHVLRVLDRVVGPRFTAAIVALPPEPRASLTFDAEEVGRALNDGLGHPVVAADAAGGLFLDQAALAGSGVTKDQVIEALENEVTERYGNKTDHVFADVFPGLAVAFARFC